MSFANPELRKETVVQKMTGKKNALGGEMWVGEKSHES